MKIPSLATLFGIAALACTGMLRAQQYSTESINLQRQLEQPRRETEQLRQQQQEAQRQREIDQSEQYFRRQREYFQLVRASSNDR